MFVPYITKKYYFFSPASGACSTDSAGSSLSIDEGDNWVDCSNDATLSRFGANHPLTPESPIEEENCDDYVHWNGPSGLGKLCHTLTFCSSNQVIV